MEPKAIEMVIHVDRPRVGRWRRAAEFTLLFYPFRIKGCDLMFDEDDEPTIWFPNRELRMNREGLDKAIAAAMRTFNSATA